MCMRTRLANHDLYRRTANKLEEKNNNKMITNREQVAANKILRVNVCDVCVCLWLELCTRKMRAHKQPRELHIGELGSHVRPFCLWRRKLYALHSHTVRQHACHPKTYCMREKSLSPNGWETNNKKNSTARYREANDLCNKQTLC